ncbi:GcrA family cell cycle regulator [Brevundimonas sp. Root1279]|uniref:GcrA family cell cycle regulator n=1 Tax=Brevundimonas sp. Root1279 TaxID=1736443 RepID=UPI0006FB5462|nr:GcrA family cell cycle regulator [Brevundimonas sp. Root1279]KQW79736.1 hypothetical protein ASC65_14405 [Brevundimonas sp. Root1279]
MTTTKPVRPWPERDVELRKHHAQFKTSGQIAEAMSLTRNQIIGRLSRLGLKHSPEVIQANLAWANRMNAAARQRSIEALQRANAARSARALANPHPKTKRQPAKQGPHLKPAAVFGKVGTVNAAEAQRRSEEHAIYGRSVLARFAAPANDDAVLLIARPFGRCSWPVGEPDRPANQLCCGQPVPEVSNKAVETYCAEHARRAVSRSLLGNKPDPKAYERSLRRYAA